MCRRSKGYYSRVGVAEAILHDAGRRCGRREDEDDAGERGEDGSEKGKNGRELGHTGTLQ